MREMSKNAILLKGQQKGNISAALLFYREHF